MRSSDTYAYRIHSGLATTGQTPVSPLAVPLMLAANNNQSSYSVGEALSYVVTTDMPNGTAHVVVATEEDFSDIRAADEALEEARAKGVRRWEVVKKELGL